VLDTPSGEPYELPEGITSPETEAAQAPVDTTAFRRDPPWMLGVSAGYLSNSWVEFALAHVRHAVSEDRRFQPTVRLLNASGVGEQQAADIDRLVADGVHGILYWSADDAAIDGALARARAAGVATISVGSGLAASGGTVANAYIDQYELGYASAAGLVAQLDGSGRIAAMLPIEGTVAAVNQARALADVLDAHPEVELVTTAYGDWNREKARTIAEEWIDTMEGLDGVFSPAGQMSVGVAEAYAAAAEDIALSPADEYNGWLRWIVAHPEANAGVITFSPAAGAVGLAVLARILSGAPAMQGEQVPSRYYAPDDAAALAQLDEPDDWWANDLPAEFLPDR
jgi:ABC-type sugar transport system substrate-binding protein